MSLCCLPSPTCTLFTSKGREGTRSWWCGGRKERKKEKTVTQVMVADSSLTADGLFVYWMPKSETFENCCESKWPILDQMDQQPGSVQSKIHVFTPFLNIIIVMKHY